MPQAFYILSGALLTLACALACGRLLFQRLRLQFHREEETPFALVCGASLLHLVIFALASVGAARKAVFLGVAVVILGWSFVAGVWSRSTRRFPPLPALWRWALLVLYAAYGFLYVTNAMAPEMSPDGSAYHLGLVARYLRDHGFSRITTNMYASLTQGIEMLYMFAFAFGRHSSAALVHCVFTLALPLLVLNHARRSGFPVAGVGAAALVLCSPLVGVDGTTAYNDVAVSALVFSVFCLLEIWLAERTQALLIPIGLVAGFCFASKYTAALAIPYAGLWILWRTWRTRQPVLRPALVFSACVLLMAVPWMVKNWIIVGNPLSPFANRFFPNPNVRISFEKEYFELMSRYGDIKDWKQIALEATARGEKLAGMLGAVFILTPLALLALRDRAGRRILLAAAVFFATYVNNIGARFLLPSMPFFALALAMTLARTPAMLPIVVALHALTSWPHVLTHLAPGAWRLNRIPVSAALRATPEEHFLTERFHGYTVARMVEDFVPKGERVFTFSGIPEAYTTREVLVSYQAGYNNMLSDVLWAALFPGAAPARQTRFSFPAAEVRKIRLWQAASSPATQWSINELRVLTEVKEVPRRAEWRVTAWPNHWDAPLAVDNSVVTRWKTWEPIRSGMFFELDLGRPELIDGVLLETVNDQAEVQLKLFGWTGKDGWKALSIEPRHTDLPAVKGMRRAAAEEFRAQGIRYIVVSAGDPCDEDFRLNAAGWGAQKVAERGGTRLYYLEGFPNK